MHDHYSALGDYIYLRELQIGPCRDGAAGGQRKRPSAAPQTVTPGDRA
ncbi:MAG: hypothetical protein U5K76_10210 [Woeseiaceae bacterium]|nr:hypothetical protein [Woeseiaceae bacterium]